MSVKQWQLIGLLAFCAYAIRFAGLLAGDWIERHETLKAFLYDLPGCLVTSLAGAELAAWKAAPIALAIAIRNADVVLVMAAATAIFAAVRLKIV